MSRLARLASSLCAACIGLTSFSAFAEPLKVAVASNFRPTMELLGRKFEDDTGFTLSASYGSTGKHYAQIVNGAPFSIFLAADVERPRLLESSGIAVAGTRFTYAVGKLVLWTAGEEGMENGLQRLREGQFRFIAIANPATAPYGRAAQQALTRLGLWETFQPQIVRGENIGQAYGFVRSGNAELGLLAWSQLRSGEDIDGSAWLVPEDLYDPIEQQAVVLVDGEASRAFLDFLRSDRAATVIRDHGYSVP